ncbi:hypothetical protein S83_062276, partial [Arachis hypogaea]
RWTRLLQSLNNHVCQLEVKKLGTEIQCLWSQWLPQLIKGLRNLMRFSHNIFHNLAMNQSLRSRAFRMRMKHLVKRVNLAIHSPNRLQTQMWVVVVQRSGRDDQQSGLLHQDKPSYLTRIQTSILQSLYLWR